ncbi:hypothetical protein AOA59_21000 [Pseudomonas sp. 2822-15]|uniref:hypothetical protein n=1 Tax=Pseudomonas sp. 2822-15 TaxID=1712677 RepID=UPI000C14DC5B|nr:hypothetical protein [Pseudomonas sp. 2822-15]PIB42530.1 hypothetical protein AOA59_21000 [Pseudomonas sp. 2822-15]
MSEQDFASRLVVNDKVFIERPSQAKAALKYAEIKTETEYVNFEKKLAVMNREETEYFLNQAQAT